MNYRKIWEKSFGKIPVGMEIHHRDGNRRHNNIENLQLVTIEEHYEIHRKQGNLGAMKAILMRMSDLGNSSDITRQHQLQLLDEGRHNFQKMSKERRKQISQGAGMFTLANKTGIHKLNADPILAKENSSKAGKRCFELKSGRYSAEKHGSKYVKNTFWWTNDQNERLRRKDKPDGNWQKGMKYDKR